jgi:hypothetical protein
LALGATGRVEGFVKRLLILSCFGAVHYGNYNSRNDTWSRLQRRFIDATTTDYDFAVYLNRVDPQLFPRATIIGENQRTRGPLESVTSIEQLLAFARANPYENYLILDSDAFPVRPDWLNFLLQRMGSYKYAAPIRFENLDTFPHPCAFFIKGEAIHDPLDFTPTFHYRNLLGERIFELGTGVNTQHLFPLLRSNQYNPHPILAGLYYDLFYHHGAGSRKVYLRSFMSGYYSHLAVADDAEDKIFCALNRDPDQFIARLRGADEPALAGTVPE